MFFHGAHMPDLLKKFFSPKSLFLSIFLFEMFKFFVNFGIKNQEVPISQ